MRNLCILLCLVCGLSACSAINDYFEAKRAETKAQQAEQLAKQVKEAHPVGASYEVLTSNGERKQMSIFYNGEGMARILYRDNGKTKVLVDYLNKQITSKDFNTNWQETKQIDEFAFPCILNAKDASARKAECLGMGITRGFPYHRWGLKQENGDEWEVWTDDNDSFPVYFRSIKGGDVTTWMMVNAWIDGSTYDKPTFFTLEPDPLPPAPEVKEEEPEAETQKKHRHRHSQRHRAQKKTNKIAGG